MKISAPSSSLPSFQRVSSASVTLGAERRLGAVHAVRWLLAAGCVALMATPVRADQEVFMDIGVRSAVVDQPPKLTGKSNLQQAGEHGKIYGILAVQPAPSEVKLVKPVDANAIMQLLHHELNTHGFQRVEQGRHPEILLTVLYGRGYLVNPYMQDAGPDTPPEASAFGVTSNTITGMPTQLFKEMGTGFVAKAQKAQFEKLFIRVTAWSYPADPKTKPRRLWNTTITLDDPDHRDLNGVAAEMLRHGSQYFGKQIDEPEIDIYAPLPEGHVNVGTPEVVEPPAAKGK